MELLTTYALLGVILAPFGFAAWHGSRKDLFIEEFMLRKNSFGKEEVERRQKKCLMYKIKKYMGLAVGLGGTLPFPVLSFFSHYHLGPH